MPSPSAARPWWTDLSDDELLDVPLRRLALRIEGSRLERLLARLAGELESAGLTAFRPYAWLSTSWFTPHGTTGFAKFWKARFAQLMQAAPRLSP